MNKLVSVVQISVSATFTFSVDTQTGRKSSFSDHRAAKNWLRFKNGGIFRQPCSLFSIELVTLALAPR